MILKGDFKVKIPFVIIFVLLIHLSLFGCATAKDISIENTTFINNTTTNITENQPVSLNVEIPLLTISGYEDYLLYIEESGDNIFLKYDQIKSLGEFKSLVVLSGGYNGDYSWLFYNLMTFESTPREFCVYIKDLINYKATKESAEYHILDFPEGTVNLLSINTTVNGTVVIKENDVEYSYVNGKLISISWIENNTEFIISGFSSFSKVPDESAGFLFHLLNRNESVSYVHKLNEEINKCLINEEK